MRARMVGPVKNRVGMNVSGNECPGFVFLAYISVLNVLIYPQIKSERQIQVWAFPNKIH